MNITEKDRRLLKLYWDERLLSSDTFDRLADQADTDDARSIFRQRANAAYPYEEASADMI